ncbi:MAG: bifunctional phosphopantothenoylcysteine decarboxylase/phosphopantothenate--cysteine ligase CoaBC [Hydrogenobacter sp.]|uniref:bifunctional phosphopantothenoylcysteine decarboxylase/phosphopantothenate--cysteine ligase CoaBC n=1 Tax=Hydrogenobacter thermophilus TaxID=940 RepID=UPI0030FB6C74
MTNVLLGVSSSIAIYKACDLVRSLKKKGYQVRVIMTPFSERFVSRLTFEALTGYKVYSDWQDDPLAHINLARWCDVFVIAPCSVNTLSKIALGIGDNLLTTTVLAHNRELLIAPAANTHMYQNPLIREHVQKLKAMGHIIIEPEEGKLVCEEEGQGKLASEDRILDWVEYAIRPKPLKDKKVLITCGATREHIDSVRFISNSSSGKMGFALASVFRWYGAQVKVVAGFTTAKEPTEIEVLKVVSAQEMYQKVMELKRWADIIVMNAAVSDYMPENKQEGKMKKSGSITLKLVRTPDILEELGRHKDGKFLVGFSLEEEGYLLENSRKKLKAKNLDMIVANPLEVMDKDFHTGYILYKDGTEEQIELGEKLSSAELIIKRIIDTL